MELVVALIAAGPPTVAAIAAWVNAKAANRAVNQRAAHEPKLWDISMDTNQRVTDLGQLLHRHLEWHDAHPDITKRDVTDAVDEAMKTNER